MDKRRLPFTNEHKQKIREAKLEYKPTKEHIENARNGLIEYYKNHPEAKEKISKKHKGLKHTSETKIKISKSLGGRRKERFYGMTKSEWRETQLRIKQRDNFTCQSCYIKGTSKTLNVHHIKPYKFSKDNSDDNLTTLCIPCHGSIEYFTLKQYQEVINAERQDQRVLSGVPEIPEELTERSIPAAV